MLPFQRPCWQDPLAAFFFYLIGRVGVRKTHCYPFLLDDRPHGGKGPLVYRTDYIMVGGRVGEGVDL